MLTLQACLNGSRRRGDHPGLPVTAAEAALDASRVSRVGVRDVHVHPKGADGMDTLEADAVADLVEHVRAAAPGVRVGVTTGAWASTSPQARIEAVRRWDVLPDHASVNWHEDGAEDLATALLDLGVDVDAGLWTAASAHAWADSAMAGRCRRVLVELPPDAPPDDVGSWADAILEAAGLDPAQPDPRTAVLVHGEDGSAWPALAMALRRGFGTRIGLEDTLVMPDGSPAAGNAELVATVRGLAAAIDRARASTPAPGAGR